MSCLMSWLMSWLMPSLMSWLMSWLMPSLASAYMRASISCSINFLYCSLSAISFSAINISFVTFLVIVSTFRETDETFLILLEASIKVCQPLRVDKRFKNASHLEAVIASRLHFQFPQKTKSNDFVQIDFDLVDKLRFIAAIRQKNAHQLDYVIERQNKSGFSPAGVEFGQAFAQKGKQETDRKGQRVT